MVSLGSLGDAHAVFFTYGGLILVIMAGLAAYWASSCPYSQYCVGMFAALVSISLVSGIQGCFELLTGMAYLQCEKMTLDDLQTEKMSNHTRRTGKIALGCPRATRILMLINGVVILGGLAFGAMCQFPEYGACANGQAPPIAATTVTLVIGFVMVAGCGYRAARHGQEMPHLYQPDREDGGSNIDKGAKLLRFFHP
mmetsp:Transcript_13011/g.23926  ORF Transcript_13011/g.23926 Transcript_13011/m.23926 type:complete len:197 (+) Transcript_13011:71-661(+)